MNKMSPVDDGLIHVKLGRHDIKHTFRLIQQGKKIYQPELTSLNTHLTGKQQVR